MTSVTGKTVGMTGTPSLAATVLAERTNGNYSRGTFSGRDLPSLVRNRPSHADLVYAPSGISTGLDNSGASADSSVGSYLFAQDDSVLIIVEAQNTSMGFILASD